MFAEAREPSPATDCSASAANAVPATEPAYTTTEQEYPGVLFAMGMASVISAMEQIVSSARSVTETANALPAAVKAQDNSKQLDVSGFDTSSLAFFTASTSNMFRGCAIHPDI